MLPESRERLIEPVRDDDELCPLARVPHKGEPVAIGMQAGVLPVRGGEERIVSHDSR